MDNIESKDIYTGETVPDKEIARPEYDVIDRVKDIIDSDCDSRLTIDMVRDEFGKNFGALYPEEQKFIVHALHWLMPTVKSNKRKIGEYNSLSYISHICNEPELAYEYAKRSTDLVLNTPIDLDPTKQCESWASTREGNLTQHINSLQNCIFTNYKEGAHKIASRISSDFLTTFKASDIPIPKEPASYYSKDKKPAKLWIYDSFLFHGDPLNPEIIPNYSRQYSAYQIFKAIFPTTHTSYKFTDGSIYFHIKKEITDLSRKILIQMANDLDKENNWYLSKFFWDETKSYREIILNDGEIMDSLSDMNKAILYSLSYFNKEDTDWSIQDIPKSLKLEYLNKALNLTNNIKDESFRANTLLSLVSPLKEEDNINLIKEILVETKEISESISNPYETFRIKRKIARGWKYIGEIEKASEVTIDIVKDTMEGFDSSRSQVSALYILAEFSKRDIGNKELAYVLAWHAVQILVFERFHKHPEIDRTLKDFYFYELVKILRGSEFFTKARGLFYDFSNRKLKEGEE